MFFIRNNRFVFIDLSEQSDKSKQDDTNQPDKNNGGQLIQGVIDVYFEEDGSLILVDYKTDKVSKKKAVKTNCAGGMHSS